MASIFDSIQNMFAGPGGAAPVMPYAPSTMPMPTWQTTQPVGPPVPVSSGTGSPFNYNAPLLGSNGVPSTPAPTTPATPTTPAAPRQGLFARIAEIMKARHAAKMG